METTRNLIRTFTANLIIFGSLTGAVNAAITVVGDPTSAATVQVTAPITWTMTTTGFVRGVVLDEAMSTPDGSQTVSSLPINLILTNLDTFATVDLGNFVDGNLIFGELTSRDSYFATDGATLAVTAGDRVQLSASTPINFSDPSFDPDWTYLAFTGNTYLFSSSGVALSGSVAIPEPSSILLWGLGVLSFITRRSRTS